MNMPTTNTLHYAMKLKFNKINANFKKSGRKIFLFYVNVKVKMAESYNQVERRQCHRN